MGFQINYSKKLYLNTPAAPHSMLLREGRCGSAPPQCGSLTCRWSHTWSPRRSLDCRCIYHEEWGAAHGSGSLRKHTHAHKSLNAPCQSGLLSAGVTSVSLQPLYPNQPLIHPWIQNSEKFNTRTATVGGPRPAAGGQALDRASSYQPVPSIAGHFTAAPQGAPVAPTSRRMAGRLAVGQAHGMTPVRVYNTHFKIGTETCVWSNLASKN